MVQAVLFDLDFTLCDASDGIRLCVEHALTTMGKPLPEPERIRRSIGLSLRYRTPITIAWSTPGAALLITTLGNFTLAEAIGAFVVCALLLSLLGLSGAFERVMRHLPASLAAALLAGIPDGAYRDLLLQRLTEMTGVDDEQARALIMKAREHWFTA